MEIIWKWQNVLFAVLIVGFCNGFPINSVDNNTGHAQFLTGIAAILITIGSIILAGCLCCQRRRGFQEFHNSPVVATSTAISLDPGHINPIANGEFTIFTPLHPTLNNNVFLGDLQVLRRTLDDYACGDLDVRKWFENAENDFPRVKLKYIRELGNGRFGKVVEGAALELDSDRAWTPVVVRILDAARTALERVIFLNDALFYLAPPHPNILALRGRCLTTAPFLLLQESCLGGDLKSRLRNSGNDDKILEWCCQLSSALRHLHDHGFIHPDLAARNCLLTSDLTLKLGDYSLSFSKYPEDYYKGGEPPIPVRWRSPESLDCTPTTIQPKTLTMEANVWALGVVMWEICENGSQPYAALNDDEVISMVFGSEGLRLDGPSKPVLYSDYIFRLIKMCWNSAESRPKVVQIDMMLSDLMQVHRNTQNSVQNVNNDFDRRWESLKPNTITKTDNNSICIEMEGETEETLTKPMSPSLNNLHGSLDNLPNIKNDKAECSKNINSSNTSPKANLNFKLGLMQPFKSDKQPDSPVQVDSMTDSLIYKQQLSSGSDTEEENWKKKIERGAYSEKVRLKSRSVADLMVLTHIDYSESETETPLPSMDYFKPTRSFRKSNLETTSLNFSSEGNLLNIEDTFEQELKKLQVERRDSLLFIPAKKPQNNSNLSLLHELNSPAEIKPINQIYNIFNMTIDNFDMLRTSGSKLQDMINIGDDNRAFSRQDSENKSDLGYATLHNSERNSDFGSVDGEHLLEDGNWIIKTEIEEKLKNCETALLEKDNTLAKQTLPDILASLDQEHEQVAVDLLKSNLFQMPVKDEDENEESQEKHDINVQTSVPKLSDLVLNNCELKQSDSDSESPEVNSKLETSESQILVPDLHSESVESKVYISSVSQNLENNTERSFTDDSRQIQPSVESEKSLLEKCAEINEFLKAERGNVSDQCRPVLSNSDSPKLVETNRDLPTSEKIPADCSSLPEDEVLPALDLTRPIQANHFENVITNSPSVASQLDEACQQVTFDLSDSQQETKPNSLTHTSVFSSTPFGKKQNASIKGGHPSLNLFDSEKEDDEYSMFSSNFFTLDADNQEENKMNYSLETWDNFLGKSFDSNRKSEDSFFDSFTSEPQSMLFVENAEKVEAKNQDVGGNGDCAINDTYIKENTAEQNGTFTVEPKNDKTFDVEKDGTFTINEKSADENSTRHWESGEGWFLHPQSNSEKLTGEIEAQPSTSSYIRFGVDDEIMTAIRNELLEKLPQAQSASQENVKEEQEEDEEHNEVFLRYNVYNTPLSPIPEETSLDENDEEITRENVSKLQDTDTEWSDQCALEDQGALSSQTETQPNVRENSEASNQSSCCSNDTLFNFDDFVSINDKDAKYLPETPVDDDEDDDDVFYKDEVDNDNDQSDEKTLRNSDRTESETFVENCNDLETKSRPQTSLDSFLDSERKHASGYNLLPFLNKVAAPLPSPEDTPWKSLPASLLTFKTIQKPDLIDLIEPEAAKSDSQEKPTLENVDVIIYENINNKELEEEDNSVLNLYENDLIEESTHEQMLGVLTDIRFSGPTDNQLMSTSFSESNETEEQDWDSGSDTRSSSSGEFIWKEDEHEESLKALKAHDLVEDIQPMKEIAEEITESDVSTSSSDEEGENLEFVPSAWDKFATPTKSALRSPEKSLDRTEQKKSKGVWFKKQKYHCVYEYPREPESPVVHSQDLWKPQIDYVSYTDWEFDLESYLPPPTADSDINPSTFTFKPKINNSRRSLYYLTSVIDILGDGSSTSKNGEEEIPSRSSSAIYSQFFPGASSWIDNVTPDSGLEDSTPVSEAMELSENYRREVLPLKKLAAQVINNKNNKISPVGSKEALGGLRHTRSKLKLDLPPSPSAFTTSKSFTVEPIQEPVVLREKPTFSTFGKSRFLVQHVDTPPDDQTQQNKNVCFDVIPYKPLNIISISAENSVTYERLKNDCTEFQAFSDKKEVFNKGEASLLDSADEDSGIESSTLERKANAVQKDLE